jgi:hypothetical protein
MLFTGAAQDSGRVTVEDGGVVDHIVAGFAYTSADALVLDTSNDPQTVIKGIGIRNTGAVCATTTTTGTRVVEGVRISDAGKLVYADAASQAATSGNPIRTNGALAVALSAMFGMFLATQSGDFIVTDSGDELEVGL